jgi:hypothetical protein
MTISGVPNYPTSRIRKIMFQSVPGWRLITATYTKMEAEYVAILHVWAAVNWDDDLGAAGHR